jgi:hypothetical protein
MRLPSRSAAASSSAGVLLGSTERDSTLTAPTTRPRTHTGATASAMRSGTAPMKSSRSRTSGMNSDRPSATARPMDAGARREAVHHLEVAAGAVAPQPVTGQQVDARQLEAERDESSVSPVQTSRRVVPRLQRGKVAARGATARAIGTPGRTARAAVRPRWSMADHRGVFALG